MARTSAFSFKGTQADVRQIADTLGVNFVLEGTVRKSGTRLRVTAELINAADGCQVWSERYDRELEMRDLFEVQDEMTRAVLDAITPNLPRTQRAAVVNHGDTECCGPRTVSEGTLPSVQNDAVRHRGGRSTTSNEPLRPTRRMRSPTLDLPTRIACTRCRSNCRRQRSDRKRRLRR